MTTIYKHFQMRFSEAWYQLSDEEQAGLMANVRPALDKAGGRVVILCGSSWSSEEWLGFGVEEFPWRR